MKKLVFESELLKETRALMKSRSHTTTISRISEDTTLDKNWLYSFENGKCEDPGVARVETLNNYLKKVLKNG